MSAPEHLTIACDGASILARRYRKDGAPRLLLSHGNGFGIDGYRTFWEQLTDDYDVIVYDLRNHGRNPLHDVEQHTIENMAIDHGRVLEAVNAAFGKRPTAGLFHSVSSIAAIMAVHVHGTPWDALVLYDPPLIAPDGNALRANGQGVDNIFADNARKRQHRFERVEELADIYSARLARDWVEGAAFDMADGTTRPSASGGFELSCPGEYEARIYLNNARTESWAAMASLPRATTMILGADPNGPRPLAPAKVGPAAAAHHGLRHVIVPGTNHMLQVEKPDVCARETKTFLREVGL